MILNPFPLLVKEQKKLESIYVLHAFGKKTQKTSKKEIELGQQRYQQMIQFRQQLQEG
jgi:phage-related protein